MFNSDPKIATLIQQEQKRQEESISLIASENYAPPEILQAAGSALTNKYAEGLPGKRYYAGCSIVDEIEKCAQERCCTLFGADYANVQPHSGSQANMAAYFALLKPGDTVMALEFSHGGHLTHGHPRNFSGQLYNFAFYGVDSQTEMIDYAVLEKLAHKSNPRCIVAGASAYPRTIDFVRLASIAHEIGAFLMVDMAHIAGLVASNEHPTPVGYADIITSTTHKTLRGPRGAFILSKKDLAPAIDRAVMPGVQGGPFMHTIAAKATTFLLAQLPEFKTYQQNVKANARVLADELAHLGHRIVSGGTDTHLLIIDLRSIKMTGKEAEEKLEAVGITTSRSCIPFDAQPPWIASGLRLGTAAATTRGMGVDQMREIAQLIHKILQQKITNAQAEQRVKHLCNEFAIYKN